MTIEIYSKTSCPYCQMAKQYLTDQGLAYVELLFDDDDRRQQMYDQLGLVGGQRTVPQIFVLGEQRRRIGGYFDLLHSDLASPVIFNLDF